MCVHARGGFRKAYFKLLFGFARSDVVVVVEEEEVVLLGLVRFGRQLTGPVPAWLPGLSFLPRNHYADRKLPFYR